jgi:enoyl-CoA hydratase
MPFADKELIARKENGVMTVTLNRPEALNALTLEMVRMLAAGLSRWEKDDSVKAIIFEGAGDRAFCAGGDIKASYNLGMQYRRGAVDENVLSIFFAEEYRLNRQLFHYRKPLFALMNGITMGGGFGIAGPCRYRIATEKTVFAMPETKIGFFPDIGSAWFLNRAPGKAGTYLGLTGNSINAADTLWSGMATHMTSSDFLPALKDALEKLAMKDDLSPAAIQKMLTGLSTSAADAGALQENSATTGRCFAHNSIEAIIEALAKECGPWAKTALDDIAQRSPTSLKVSLAHIRRAEGQDFDTIIARDFTLAQHFMKGHDFYEGVRAAVIDKDRTPRWEPESLSLVSQAEAEKYFLPTGFELDEMAA